MNVWKSFANHEITHSMAHYLTTLHKLHVDRGYARVSDVAKDLEVTKGSVSTQMKHLKEKGLVVEDDNRFLRLTEEGESIALDVIHNRELLIQFIRNVLKVDPVQAETDACKIEHLVSKETSERLLAMVQLLQSGDPTSRAFLDTFEAYTPSCPTLEDCAVCEDECLRPGGDCED